MPTASAVADVPVAQVSLVAAVAVVVAGVWDGVGMPELVRVCR